MKFTLFVLLALLDLVCGSCVWYGICSKNDPDHPQYCAYNGSARPQQPDAAKIISTLCPEYAGKDVCCDKDQLSFFDNSSKTAYMLLRRCPSCFANFRLLFCSMTCDPDQSDFLVPLVEDKLVKSVVYKLTTNVADTFFNSCKDVTFNNGRAIDVMCVSTSCTSQKLLDSLGARGPFPITFEVSESGNAALHGNSNKPLNISFYQCNEPVPRRSADSGGLACSCMDCASSCSDNPDIPPQPSPPMKIFGIDAWWFGGFIAFATFTLIFGTYQFWIHIYKRGHFRFGNDHIDSTAQRQHQDEIDLLGRSSKQPDCLSRLSAYLDEVMTDAFTSLGLQIARHPFFTLMASAVVLIILCAGMSRMTITTDPIELWSGSKSLSRMEKDYFDRNFAPFYRTEQIIIRPNNNSNFTHPPLYPNTEDITVGAALSREFLLQVYDLQSEIHKISVPWHNNSQITLQDICFQPLAPDNLECAVTSPLEYFRNNLTLFNYILHDEFGDYVADYLDHLLFCAQSPLSVTDSPLDASAGCLASSGIPVLPQLAFGRFNESFYNGSEAVVLTFLVNNHPDPRSKVVEKAKLWEAEYIKVVQHWAKIHSNFTVNFQAERSVEDAIESQSNADVFTVLISYLVMFVYVSLFLGSYRSWKTIFVDLHITLGLGGVLIVLASVAASVGFWSYLHVPITLIIIEVIPFLVLAVGVDNIFILVYDFEFGHSEDMDKLIVRESYRNENIGTNRCTSTDDEKNDDDDNEIVPADTSEILSRQNYQMNIKRIVERRIATTLGSVGPSILLTGLAESVAFFCGSLTTMPAVRVFALYAGMAIVFNFLLQVFAFLALFTLDARRRLTRRFDLFCCWGLKTNGQLNNSTNQQPYFMERDCKPSTEPCSNSDTSDSLSLSSNAMEGIQEFSNQQQHEVESAPWVHRLVADCWTPMIFSGWLRPVILVVAMAWLCFAIAILPNGLHIGMDQKLSMPLDSYMLRFFEALSTDLRIGPPLYFVVTDKHDYTEKIGQNQVCGGVGCSNISLMEKISDASKISNFTWIATPASSWLDDYFDWLDPTGSPFCCRLDSKGEFCPTSSKSPDCYTCPVNIVDYRPSREDFQHYLPYFLTQNPGPMCPKGGHAAYSVAVKLINETTTTTRNLFASPNYTRIGPTYFMAYHTVMKTPDDYVNALKLARQIAAQITNEWHKNDSISYEHGIPSNIVYPYSVFYVFYEQYLTLVNEAAIQLCVCLLAIALVTLLYFGLNIIAMFMVILGVVYIVISVAAVMVLWSISLNALSLVNLVVAIGISVEFCAHIVRAFTVSIRPTRLERAREALREMGSSILRGITLTKLGGIVVLATSNSRLFQIFYFRMYLSMIMFGALTGLLFLPVFLSYFGPPLNIALARRHNTHVLGSSSNRHNFQSNINSIRAGQTP